MIKSIMSRIFRVFKTQQEIDLEVLGRYHLTVSNDGIVMLHMSLSDLKYINDLNPEDRQPKQNLYIRIRDISL